jgi:CheY-like chemotaxis protein
MQQTGLPGDAPDGPDSGDDLSQRVLVVDDNADVAASLALLLRLEGFAARSVDSPERAVQMAQEWKPDAAVLDLNLPRTNGFQLARLLKARSTAGHELRLVAQTGLDFELTDERCAAAGFIACLRKPFEVEQLVALLRIPSKGAG